MALRTLLLLSALVSAAATSLQPVDFPCPLVLCASICENGVELDANGCSTCICKSQCGVGEEYDSLTDQCVAVNCKAASACPYGKVCKEYDVPVNCFRAPCPQFFCEDKCQPLLCDLACPENGFMQDENGCDICRCKPPVCEKGEAYDETGKCVPVSCDAVDACSADQICEPISVACVRSPCPQFQCKPKCKPVLCKIYCEYGFQQDENGCEICACNSPPCGKGEEFDSQAGKCVPVTCDASGACGDDEICEPIDVICKRNPCPQFTCKKKCGDGEEFDTLTKECVPVSCDSPNACSADEICQKADIQCKRAPCPQFTCEKKCPLIRCYSDCKYGTVTDANGCPTCQCRCPPGEQFYKGTCRPVSCMSPNACKPGYKCKPTYRFCLRSFCPQFYCSRY